MGSIKVSRDSATGRVDYEWIGDPNSPIEIDERFVDPDSLPWKLIEIKGTMDWATLRRTYIREDAGYHRLYHWLVARWMRHCQSFSSVEARLILTFHIWGIGYTAPGNNPKWENLTRTRALRGLLR